jgi:hypothetical protein
MNLESLEDYFRDIDEDFIGLKKVLSILFNFYAILK